MDVKTLEDCEFVTLNEVSDIFGDPGPFGHLLFEVIRNTKNYVYTHLMFRNGDIAIDLCKHLNGDRLKTEVTIRSCSIRAWHYDLVHALEHAFGNIFERVSEGDYLNARGPFEPWLFEGGQTTRPSDIGEFTVSRYGGEAREWRGYLGKAEVIVLETSSGYFRAMIPVFDYIVFDAHTSLYPYQGQQVLSFSQRSFDGVIQNVIDWRTRLEASLAYFRGKGKGVVLGDTPWTDRILEGTDLG